MDFTPNWFFIVPYADATHHAKLTSRHIYSYIYIYVNRGEWLSSNKNSFIYEKLMIDMFQLL